MIVLPQMVKMKWCSLNKDYYIQKGYLFTKCRFEFYVYVLDLLVGSNKKIEVICDYCGSTTNKNYGDYVKWKTKSPVSKDACKKCIGEKLKESNQIIYGVNSTMQVEEHISTYNNAINEKYGVTNIGLLASVMDKRIKTNLERWGVSHSLQRPDVKQKIIKSNQERFGVDYSLQSEEVREKGRITMHKIGNVRTSVSQRYLHNLLGGVLNYPINTLSLDVAFPEEKIYIEYNGGGHNLPVIMKNMTEEKFRQKEIRRYYLLKSKGWKMIKIISPYDYLPDDEIIKNEMKNAFNWFKSEEFGHWHYNIDVGTKINHEILGKLRKVKDDFEDIKEVKLSTSFLYLKEELYV